MTTLALRSLFSLPTVRKVLYDHVLVIVVLLALPVYFFALVLLNKRKDYQPLKSRSVSLIVISTVGNLLYFIFLMTNKIISSNTWVMWQGLSLEPKSKGLKASIWTSCEVA